MRDNDYHALDIFKHDPSFAILTGLKM